MSIRQRFFIIFAIITILLIAVFVSMTLLSVSLEETANAERERFELRKLADQLRQSSDDLTRFARTYVVTGQPKYLANFNTILAIRNGVQARPLDYDRIYWDYISAGQSPR